MHLRVVSDKGKGERGYETKIYVADEWDVLW